MQDDCTFSTSWDNAFSFRAPEAGSDWYMSDYCPEIFEKPDFDALLKAKKIPHFKSVQNTYLDIIGQNISMCTLDGKCAFIDRNRVNEIPPGVYFVGNERSGMHSYIKLH
ncbi:MAG: hypothetical protein HQK83_04225 [Fibrobacteria bacterium]|nr:hypothetical protein [Fibrobacteria bacterium]